MKIYGQTDDIIVREMTEGDLETFLDFLTEQGANDDFTIEDIKTVWKFRNTKGDVQCVITSVDGNMIYGFCGIFHSNTKVSAIRIDFFEKYKSGDYRTQVKKVMMRLTLDNLSDIPNVCNTDKQKG